ncbi:alpha/beta hydrolase [Actinophytocola sp. NPDC049390]|uniref:alpha/beta hydrolase n=1 Tax=Actinophytocola sp. NPDC049390 TaxID=3363894 RepID=UPI00379A0D01
MPRWLVVSATAVVVVVVVVLALAYLFQRRLIYLPSGGPVPSASQVLPGARDVRLTTADGLALGAWYVPPTGPDLGFTVLVANGNGGDRSHRAELAAALRAEGLSVLLFDYRGYGGNPGDPTQEGLALDVRAAHAYLVDELGVPQDRLVYFGDSLGGAVVAELAIEHPPAGLLLRSPFTELADTAAEHYPFLPVRMLLRDRFPVVEHVRRLDVPVTVVYSSTDEIVPPDQSRAVASAARDGDAVEIPDTDHNDPVLLAGSQVVGAVLELVNSRR